MSTVIESFEHAGLRVQVGYEEDSSPFDPREAECNLGTMVCWHPSYVLGDEQLRSGDGRGAVEHVFETARGRTEFRSMEAVERYLRVALGAVVVLPLYLLDHSGLSMSAGSNTVGRGDTEVPGSRRDSWGNRAGWDTTMCGFIFTTEERIVELCGEPQLESDRVYCPRRWDESKGHVNWPAERSAEEWVAEQLRAEVDVYDDYLRGAVYWYSVGTSDDPYMESCGGFLGGGVGKDGEKLDGFDYCRFEAVQAAEALRAELDLDVEPDLESAVFAVSRAA